MKQTFVLIFRQGARSLNAEEQKQRIEEVREWAIRHVGNGSRLDPRVLGNESRLLGDTAIRADGAEAVIALNFLEAEGLKEATEVAQSHPGLKYGVSIEVRPWSDPRARVG